MVDIYDIAEAIWITHKLDCKFLRGYFCRQIKSWFCDAHLTTHHHDRNAHRASALTDTLGPVADAQGLTNTQADPQGWAL